MKKIFALLLCSSMALASESVVSGRSFKLGVGFTGGTRQAGVALDISLPSVVDYEAEGKASVRDIHPFVDVTLMTNHDRSIGGTFNPTTDIIVGFGIKGQVSGGQTSPVAPYTVLGGEVLFPDSSVATKSTSWGLRVGFGCDLFYLRGGHSILGVEDSAFFVEADSLLLHSRADKADGQPGLRTGLLAKVGFRSHF